MACCQAYAAQAFITLFQTIVLQRFCCWSFWKSARASGHLRPPRRPMSCTASHGGRPSPAFGEAKREKRPKAGRSTSLIPWRALHRSHFQATQRILKAFKGHRRLTGLESGRDGFKTAHDGH